MKHYFFILFLFIWVFDTFAQSKDSVAIKKDSASITATKSPKLNKNRIKRMEFNFIINRSFLVGNNNDTLAPINSFSSGNTLIAAAYNFNINAKWALHIQSGISSYKLNFSPSPKKTFPDTLSSYNKQILRFMGGQVPVGIVYTLKRNKTKDSTRIFYVEAGSILGFNLPATYKLKESLSKYKESLYLTDGWNPIQIGLYGRLGWKYLAFYGSYRLTNIFGSSNTRTDIPKPPRLEAGISIVL